MDDHTDEVTLQIDAPAEVLYDLVTDITQMGRWSPENTGGRWLGGATGPAVGARFLGWNRHGLVRWFTRATVTVADRPSAFEFQVAESKMIWGYRFEPDGSGTLVTEYRRHTRPVNPVIGLVQRSGLIGKDREQLMVDGMRATLERLKSAAEASGASL
jgi:uncharacterized protein YndB with AHSA1/START domain